MDDNDFNHDYAEDCDYNYLKKSIKDVLKRYYPTNDAGDPNPNWDDSFTAIEALDEIYEIIGGI